MKRFTLKELDEMGMTKGEAVKRAGMEDYFTCIDYALPQYWLDDTVDRVFKDIVKVNYSLYQILTAKKGSESPKDTDIKARIYSAITGTTVWAYSESNSGQPISICEEVQEMIWGIAWAR